MTRAFAAAALAIVLAASVSLPAHAQSDQDTSSTGECFPWQELRNGACVSRPNPAPIPPPAPLAADPCSGGTRNLSARCPCPASTHPDPASGKCVADAAAIVAPTKPVVCDGGTVANGACQCPAGFSVMPASGGANGGTCLKMHAENCIGGALTVSGACLCTSQVVMDGLTYDLELRNSKCVPKRCPVETVLEGGKCIASSAAAATPPEVKTNATSPEKPPAEGADHRHDCPRGTLRTHAGCVTAH